MARLRKSWLDALSTSPAFLPHTSYMEVTLRKYFAGPPSSSFVTNPYLSIPSEVSQVLCGELMVVYMFAAKVIQCICGVIRKKDRPFLQGDEFLLPY